MSSKTMSKDLYGDKRMGFFIYLFVEAIMFSTLFATYIIYTPPQMGLYPGELFKLHTVVLASVFLLSSSGTLMIAEKGLDRKNARMILTGLLITFTFGATFMYFEVDEFYKFISEGHTVAKNNFLASYFVLVGLHASHVLFGLGWMIVLLIQRKLLPFNLFAEKHRIFNYYWHFVDIIWVLIVIIVYTPYLF
ncbi:cytochrome c oxidase subunit 3 [Thalassobacillus devorans]|uniref:cytochrome c oxidase subunit 3 n=1 Tax=Thalassobacillus devorans TaxID=279813 RepID=UPI00048A9434|nr:cytochrome c oxidase subunit 3 [Thalassobacillus devorans]